MPHSRSTRKAQPPTTKLLLIQLKRIGDALLTTPVISTLREHLPDAHITLALDRATAALAPALGADRTIIFRRGFAGAPFWHELATGKFDYCIDLTGNDRSGLATALSRAPRRITWMRFSKKPLRRAVYSEFVESSVKHRHTADHHTDLLQPLGIHVENVPLSLHLPDEARAEATEALSAAGVDADVPFAVIHAGTARPEKYWSPERWAEIATLLRREHGLPVLLTGSRDAAERKHLEAIQRALASAGESHCPNLAGRLSLLGTAAVLSRARLLCAVDSAPVHLADALDVPLVALFGPTNPYHWRPRRASACVVTAAGAPPFSPAHPQAPMSEISTAAVAEAIRTLAGASCGL